MKEDTPKIILKDMEGVQIEEVEEQEEKIKEEIQEQKEEIKEAKFVKLLEKVKKKELIPSWEEIKEKALAPFVDMTIGESELIYIVQGERAMVVIKFEKLTFLNDGYVLTIRNKMGLLNIFLEPQDVISITENYIILCDDFAKYIPDLIIFHHRKFLKH